ncbi:hypothetical protein [Ruminococcus sp.]|uniref:hypothetical protein n=1 Tax=Ruminococcus sp. TaxID=41978 RepID=UPI001B586E6F|nr:hypothetical protein [Ruminococcus sp.]MBP5433486.1 hypothetical protein [Ruminococcus sp.]
MTIYKGKEAVCGIQLTIDRWWRYAMTAQDTLTVKFIDVLGHVITKTFGSESVDSIDKQVGVILTGAETSTMSAGRGIITAYMNDLVVIPPTEIYVKEAL